MATLGLNAKAYRNTGTYASPTWSEVTNIRDLTLNLEKAEADVTTRASNGWRNEIGTLKNAGVEFEMVYEPSDTNFAAIQEAFLNDTLVDMIFLSGDIEEADNEGLRAEFSVNNFSRSEPLEDALKNSVSLKPGNPLVAPTWETTPLGS